MTDRLNTEAADSFVGDEGDDTFLIPFKQKGGGDDFFDGGGGSDFARGGIDHDSLFGGTDNDFLYGGDGHDLLNGGPGNDYLDAGTGVDTVIGGGGNDRILVSSKRCLVMAGVGTDRMEFTDIYGKIALVLSGGSSSRGPVFSGVEEFMGASHDDSFSGAESNDFFIGNGGNDTLIGRGGNDFLDGGAGSFSAADDDTLNGGAGNDKLFGGAASDRLVGGDGNDFLDTGGSGGAGGNDTALGGAGNDTLTAADGNDVLNGGSGSDTAILFPTFTNVICDLQLSDPVEIGTDETAELISIENVVISGNSIRADWLFGNNAANKFDSGLGDDWLMGRGGTDTLLSGGGNDKLEGGDGNDLLNGGSGADLLIGGSGQDTMTGGTEIDTFKFDGVADSPTATSDRFTDFVSGTDLLSFADFIDLSDAVIPGPRDVTFTFIGSGNFSGDADEVRFAGGVLEADSNRDGIADVAIVMTGVASLVLADFLF